jgi:hypothetical protein
MPFPLVVAAYQERALELSGMSSPGACATAHRSFKGVAVSRRIIVLSSTAPLWYFVLLHWQIKALCGTVLQVACILWGLGTGPILDGLRYSQDRFIVTGEA